MRVFQIPRNRVTAALLQQLHLTPQIGRVPFRRHFFSIDVLSLNFVQLGRQLRVTGAQTGEQRANR